MPDRTLVIAECGSSWHFGLNPIGNAFKMIEAAKACDASAVKFQFTSNATAMAKRRNLGPDAEAMYRRYLQYPVEYLHKFKAKCDEVGVEFMCTVFLIEDIATIAPLVKRFKISAYESQWQEFVEAHDKEGDVIISVNPGKELPTGSVGRPLWIHCISEYPAPIDKLELASISRRALHGFSDHSTSTLTGALAVASRAKWTFDFIVEKHVRLSDTPNDNPDYPHSLCVDAYEDVDCRISFSEYVNNIREAERAL